jgi:hypothetical protein
MLEIIFIFVAAVVFSVVALGFFVVLNLIKLVIWPFKVLLRPAVAGHGMHVRDMGRMNTAHARVQPARPMRVLPARSDVARAKLGLCRNRLCAAPVSTEARFCARCGFPTPLGMNASDRRPAIALPVAHVQKVGPGCDRSAVRA